MSSLLRELVSDTCRCGNAKRRNTSFCFQCFHRLTPEAQQNLYRRIGQGYEQAFDQACRALGRVRAANPAAESTTA